MNGLWVMALEIAAVALLLVLLNARGRRRDRAVGAVVGACPRALQESIALHARAPLLSRRVVVTLDMSDCDHDDVWALVRSLANALPSEAALVIGPRFDPTRPLPVSVACAASGSR